MQTAPVRPANPYRLTLRQWLEQEGFESLEDAVESGDLSDSAMAALCTEGCIVEPDGRCEHGCPSPLRALGII